MKRIKKRIKTATTVPEPVICSEAEARLATAKRDLYEAIRNDEPESLIIIYRKHGELQVLHSGYITPTAQMDFFNPYTELLGQNQLFDDAVTAAEMIRNFNDLEVTNP